SYNSHFCDALDPTVQGKFFVAWIPLDVINEQRRGLEVYESEALTYEAESKTEDLWFVPIQTSTEPTSIYASPGDFIIFNPAAVHQSGGNVSSSRRVSMEVRFFPEDTLTSKHYFDPTSGILYEPDTGPNARNSM
nr:hypothetical protein [Alphaproteobacteria bacterium]